MLRLLENRLRCTLMLRLHRFIVAVVFLVSACSNDSSARLKLLLPGSVSDQFRLAPVIEVPDGFEFNHFSLSYVVRAASGKTLIDSADVTESRISLSVPREKLDVEVLYSAVALSPTKKSEFCENGLQIKSSDLRFYRSVVKKQLDASKGGSFAVEFPELENVEIFRIAATVSEEGSEARFGLLDPLTGQGIVPGALGCRNAYVSKIVSHGVLLLPVLHSFAATNLVATNQQDSEAVVNLNLNQRAQSKAASVSVVLPARSGGNTSDGPQSQVKQGLAQIWNATFFDESMDSDKDGSTDLAELLQESDPFVAERTFYQSDAKPLPPVVTVSLNSENGVLQNDGRPVWSWQVPADGPVPYSGKFRYSFSLSDFEVSSNESSSYQYRPSSVLPDGSYTLYVRALGVNNVLSDAASANIVIDRTPPGKPVLSVAPFANEKRPTFKWSKAGPINGDSGSGLFRFWFDSEASGFLKRETYLNVAIPQSELSEGPHSFHVQEADAAGNWSEVAVGNFIVDTIAPVAPVIALDSSNRQLPVWNYSVSTDTVKVVYRLTTSTAAGSDVEIKTSGNANLSFVPSANLPEGQASFSVKSIDDAGNISNTSESSLVVDTIPPAPPTVTVSASPTRSKRPVFVFSSIEPVASRGNYRFKFGNSDFSSGAITQMADSFMPNEDFADGTHTIYVAVSDIYGNYSSVTSQSVTVDTSLPPVPLISSVTSPTKNTSFSISFTKQGSGDGTFRFKLNNSDLSSGATETTSTTYSNTFAQGSNTLYVQQRNALGSWGPSASVTFVVDTTPPPIPASFTASWVPVPGQIKVQVVNAANLSDYSRIRIVRALGNSGPGCDAATPNVFLDWTANVSGVTYTDVGLLPGALYTYEFCVEDAAGNRSVSPGTSALAGTYSLFTTSTNFDGNLKAGVPSHPADFDSGLFGADYRCQEAATAAGRTGFYRALIGDAFSGIAHRIKANATISRSNSGTPIASSETALFDWVNTPIGEGDNLLSNGTPSNAMYAWTGSDTSGMPASFPSDCLGWTSSLSGDFAQAGVLGTTTKQWISDTAKSCSLSYPLRCIYQDEPGLSRFFADLANSPAGDVVLKIGFPIGVTSYSNVYDKIEVRAKLDGIPDASCTGSGESVVYTFRDTGGNQGFPVAIGALTTVTHSAARPLERWGYRACLWDKQTTPQLITSHATPVVRVKAPTAVECNDTFVYAGDNINYGAEAYLKIGEHNPAYDTYLRFDLSAFPENLSDVTDISLELTLNSKNIAVDQQIQASHVTENWSEGTLNGSTLPNVSGFSAGLFSVLSSATVGTKHLLSISALVLNWLNLLTPNHGIKLSGVSTWAAGEYLKFQSRESANPSDRPSLRFTFVSGEPAQVIRCQ